jgi:transposase-like protein
VGFLREGVRVLAQALMDAEVTQHVGPHRDERTGERETPRRYAGGRYFPALLEPRGRAERSLVAVVQEMYIQGVSTRLVDELAQALGLQDLSKSQARSSVRSRTPRSSAFAPPRLGRRPIPVPDWTPPSSKRSARDGC